jgi:hypothetical protein
MTKKGSSKGMAVVLCLDMDQGNCVSPSAGMNSTDGKQRKEEPPPPRSSEFIRMLEAYAADLRAIIEKPSP